MSSQVKLSSQERLDVKGGSTQAYQYKHPHTHIDTRQYSKQGTTILDCLRGDLLFSVYFEKRKQKKNRKAYLSCFFFLFLFFLP